MEVEYTNVELPESFMRDVLMRAFSDYSVALARRIDGKYLPCGTGVLVQKGKRLGILTAYHCLHSCSPKVELGSKEGTVLWLCLNRGNPLIVNPDEVVEHPLAKQQADGSGPDLTFIEILSPNSLGWFKAFGSFWSLDRSLSDLLREFGIVGTHIVSIGYPEFHHHIIKDGDKTRNQIRHIIYYNVIQEGDTSERDGWDYLSTTIHYDASPGLPPSFAGLSGGPVWGMEIIHSKKTDTYSLGKSALVGITFFQSAMEDNKRRLRAHFINSIYDRAWTTLG